MRGLSPGYMNLDKSDEIQLYCEKCSAILSADTASRTILSDGNVHTCFAKTGASHANHQGTAL
jgi:hypothetical protein